MYDFIGGAFYFRGNPLYEISISFATSKFIFQYFDKTVNIHLYSQWNIINLNSISVEDIQLLQNELCI